VPAALARILGRCLEKQPAERFSSAHDVALALEALTGPATAEESAAPRRRHLVLAGVALLALGGLAAVAARPMLRERPWLLAAEAVPLSSDPVLEFHPALSKDGGRLAFTANLDDPANFDTIAGIRGGSEWSRDGRWLYVASDQSGSRQLWRIATDGTAQSQLTRNGGIAGFESADGRSVYFTREDEPGLWEIPMTGGPETRLLDQPSCWGYWASAPLGIYFLDSGALPKPELRLLRPGRRNSEHAAWLPPTDCRSWSWRPTVAATSCCSTSATEPAAGSRLDVGPTTWREPQHPRPAARGFG
jgi:hypothetical protein